MGCLSGETSGVPCLWYPTKNKPILMTANTAKAIACLRGARSSPAMVIRTGQSKSPPPDEKVATTQDPMQILSQRRPDLPLSLDTDVSPKTTASCRSVHANRNGVPSTNV